VEAVEWSQGRWVQDLCSLMEAACAGQKPEQVGPMEVDVVEGAFLAVIGHCGMDVKVQVVGAGGIFVNN